MLLIYTHKITNRLKYIFRLIIGDLLGISYELTTDADVFNAYSGSRFSYTKNPLGEELFIASAPLLFQRGIEGQEISFAEVDGIPSIYPSINKKSALGFDPFAAGFYLVSRYEEYLPYVKDEYDRFTAPISLAFQKGFLNKPMVNIWAERIGAVLKEHFSDLEIKEKHYKFIPTIDMDTAWVYREKGLLRSIGGYLKSIFSFNIQEVMERTRVLSGLQRDPLDNYREQVDIMKKYGLKPVYFILFASYGLNDKNIHVNNRQFNVLIKSLGDYAEIGIHNSFLSSYKPEKLNTERDTLSAVLNKEITKSRQHFVRLNLPYMYRNLIDLDILEDFSMGYNGTPGFRAGIADPFYFYDLDTDAPTKLKIFPFAFAINQLNPLSDPAHINLIKDVIKAVKAVNGTLIGEWDNDTLSKRSNLPDWKEAFEDILKEAST